MDRNIKIISLLHILIDEIDELEDDNIWRKKLKFKGEQFLEQMEKTVEEVDSQVGKYPKEVATQARECMSKEHRTMSKILEMDLDRVKKVMDLGEEFKNNWSNFIKKTNMRQNSYGKSELNFINKIENKVRKLF